MTRRKFASCAAGFAVNGILSADRLPSTPIGVQLFSLRRQCEKDLTGTLAWVRDIGFSGVEFAGYYGRSASELRSLLDANGLRCCGAHTPLSEFTATSFSKTLDFQHAIGNTYLIVPGLPAEYEKSADGWRRATAILNELSERLAREQMRIGYHNHSVEFQLIDGVLPWTILVQQTRPDVVLQVDTGNARIGGADPTVLVAQAAPRARTVHVKDYLPTQNDPVIGSSTFGWPAFIRAARAAGTEWFIIEHDSPDREEVRICFDRFRSFVLGQTGSLHMGSLNGPDQAS